MDAKDIALMRHALGYAEHVVFNCITITDAGRAALAETKEKP